MAQWPMHNMYCTHEDTSLRSEYTDLPKGKLDIKGRQERLAWVMSVTTQRAPASAYPYN